MIQDIQSRVAAVLAGSTRVPMGWVVATWTEVSGGQADPVTGSVQGGSRVWRARVYRGAVHFPNVLDPKVKLFTEYEAGDCLVDMAAASEMPPANVEVVWRMAVPVVVRGVSGPVTVGGFAGGLEPGYRVLLVGQTPRTWNGVYRVQADGSWVSDPEVVVAEGMPFYTDRSSVGGWVAHWQEADPTDEADVAGWMFAVSGDVDARKWVTAQSGRQQPESWDATVGGVKLVRTVGLRRAT